MRARGHEGRRARESFRMGMRASKANLRASALARFVVPSRPRALLPSFDGAVLPTSMP